MKRLWAPWRIEYIRMKKPKGCFLCQKPQEGQDAQNYILLRGERNFILLNYYPYNPGHLMVAPYRHIGDLEEMSDEEIGEHMALVKKSTRALREAFGAQGFNIGMNLGKIAGAGIADHLHTHVVPRWQGDTNFMPVLGETKVLPQALASVYSALKDRMVTPEIDGEGEAP